MAQDNRHGDGVLKYEAQLPTGQFWRRISSASASVPHFQLPGTIGILTDEGIERLFRPAEKVRAGANGQERRCGEFDGGWGQAGIFREYHIGRTRAGDGCLILPECVGVAVISFVHDDHDVSRDTGTEGDEDMIGEIG